MVDYMITRIYTPCNLYRSRKGVVGIDAYFWGRLKIPYAHALLIKPLENLVEKPGGEGLVLPRTTTWEEQLRDLDALRVRIKSEILGRTVKYYRWRILRFFMIPLPTRTSSLEELSDAVYADRILKSLKPLKPLEKQYYYTIDIEEAKPYQLRISDRMYQWLALNDDGFREELWRILKGERKEKKDDLS